MNPEPCLIIMMIEIVTTHTPHRRQWFDIFGDL